MKTAQKIKLIPMLFLLWALPISMLPRAVAKPLATAKQPAVTESASEEQLKLVATENYGKLPLRFEPNMGQSAEEVRFLSRGNGYTLFLTPNEAVFSLRDTETKANSSTLRMRFAGSNGKAALSGKQESPGKINYMVGNDRAKWRTNIPTFQNVQYKNIWPGIDMLWYGNEAELEYDFVVNPGSEVSQIQLSFEGAQKMRLDDNGNLIVGTNGEEVKHLAPVIYQETSEGRTSITGKYVIKGTNEIGFEVGQYDRDKPLVIDPVLIYSSYIGGSSADQGLAVAAKTNGEVYIAGLTLSDSASFPLKNEILDTHSEQVAFITKLNAKGTDILFSTFFGADGDCSVDGDGKFICGSEIRAIAVAGDGKIAVTGVVNNFGNDSDFPVTDNAYQKNGWCLGGCSFVPDRDADAFVTMLSADGTEMIYSTFFGGSATLYQDIQQAVDVGNSVAIDSANHIYITGETGSKSLPTKHAFQTTRASDGNSTDAFVAVFDPFASRGNDTLLYASYYGGSGGDIGRGIAVDNDRNAYIVGSTASTDLLTKSRINSPLQTTFQGGGFDGFVAKIDTEADGDSSLTYSTYFGGNINDRVESVAVDQFQRAYITGASNSSPSSFPLQNAFDSTQVNGEAFVAKLNADGTALFYSSFLGGTNGNTSFDGEEGLGITIDFAGNAYVTGRTTAGASFPSVQGGLPGGSLGTAFLSKIEATISNNRVPKLLYSTTFGGTTARSEAVAIDTFGNVYLAGTTNGGLPTTPTAFDTTFNGGTTDAFVAKFASTFNDTIGVFRPALDGLFLLRNSNTAGQPDLQVDLGQVGNQPVAGDWNGDGKDDPGVFLPAAGQFVLRLDSVNIIVNFGQAGDLAVVGDWDGNGVDTPGVFNPSTSQWQLTNGFKGQNISGSTPPVSNTFIFGLNGDLPFAGDWDGNGIDSIGVVRASEARWFLSNGFQGTVDIGPFIFGPLNSKPIAGDWNGDGVDTIGIFIDKFGTMALNNTNSPGNGVGDIVFNFGQSGDFPVAGDWDGRPALP